MADPAKVILIVDDDRDFAELLATALEDDRLRTVIVIDGISAIAQIPVLKPDLVILDLMLPGASGIEVLTQMQSGSYSKIPVIVITAIRIKPEVRDQIAQSPNVVEYFQKPLVPKQLVERTHQVLGLTPP